MAKRAVTALFDDYEEAAKAVDRIEAQGIPQADIAILTIDRKGEKSAPGHSGPTPSAKPNVHRSGVTEAAGAGAAVGGVIGGGTGLFAGLGLIAIPGIGPAVATGWLVGALTGAGVGAATGGLLGALTGAGLSDADAETYSEGLRRGGTLVTVRAEASSVARVTDILKRSGSIDLDERVQDWRAEGWTARASGRASHDRAPATPLEVPAEDDETETKAATDPTAVEHPSRRFPEQIR